MHATPITVLDRAGRHTAVYLPPPSRQPRTKAPASRYDRATIMRAAWADYRAAVRKGWTGKGFDAARFAYCLSWAWMVAKAQVAHEAELTRLDAVIADVARNGVPATHYTDPARASAIKGELLAIEYSDALGHGNRETELRAELAQLTA